MYTMETVKKTFEQITGLGRPSAAFARGAVRRRKPQTFIFPDDGTIPNNQKLPFICYRSAVRLSDVADPAAMFEQLFAQNGWGEAWRNGIYGYVHYHSSSHEVLGVARGHARVRFGSECGKTLSLKCEDVVILPAGTGHQCLSASPDLLIVGAYPEGGQYDECEGSPEEHARAPRSIAEVPLPACDPIYGPDGPLLRLWQA